MAVKIIEDWISPVEESKILGRIIRRQRAYAVGRNSILRYGSSEPYADNVVSDIIPDYLQELADRLVEEGLMYPAEQITVNQYLEGDSIRPHIDKGREIITVLSLLSEAEMRLTLPGQIRRILLQPRSLLQLTGEERYVWEHAVPRVKTERYSIVFR